MYTSRSALTSTSLLMLLCSVTLAQSSADSPAPKTGGSVSGVVFVDGQPAAGFTVSLSAYETPGQAIAKVTTGEDGSYRFEGIGPGSYAVDTYAPGLFRVSVANTLLEPGRWTRPIDITSSETFNNIDLKLITGGTISGHVVGPDGRLMAGVNVAADLVTRRSWETCTSCCCGPGHTTNNSGEYRISGLPPGTYRLLVLSMNQNPASKAYQQVYFPGVSDPHDASTVQIDSSAEVPGQDIRMPPPTDLHQVTGLVVDADTGKPVPNVNWRLGEYGTATRYMVGIPRTGNADSHGALLVQGLPPGHYCLAVTPSDAADYQSNLTSLDVESSDLSGIVLKVKRGIAVTGKVVLIDSNQTQPPPFKLSDIQLDAIQYPDFSCGLSVWRPVSVQSDGSFKLFAGPGTLSLSIDAQRSPKGATIVTIEFGGKTADRDSPIIDGQAPSDLRIIVARPSGTIEGLVKGEGATLPPSTSFQVQAIPLFKNGFPAHGLIDTQGRFSISGLMDGGYDLTITCAGDCVVPFSRVDEQVTVSNGSAPFTTIPFRLQPSVGSN